MCRPDRLDLGNRRTHRRVIRYNMCLNAFVCVYCVYIVCVHECVHICNYLMVKLKHAQGRTLPEDIGANSVCDLESLSPNLIILNG